MKTTPKQNLIAAAPVGMLALITSTAAQAAEEITMSRNTILTLIEYFPRFVLFLLALLCLSQPAIAADPDYSGDFLKRSTMTGDWGGTRNYLAGKGVTFDIDLTQTEQGVVSGGKNSSWEYGGRGDLTLLIDTGKLGLWPGGFLTAELEGNWGHGVNRSTGALMPVNTNQIFPNPNEAGVALPALNFTQFLSHYFGVIVGKLDILSADDNEFAHGKPYAKGNSQFMNTALNANPTLLLDAPYTPLAAGLIILPTKDPKAATIMLATFSSVGTAGTAGFNTLNANKLSFWGEGRVRTDFFGMTGHQLLGLIYSNKEFTSLDQRLVNVATQQLQQVKGSWAAYYNFDQYIYEPKKGSGRGLGIFGRFGASDGKPNPMHYFLSLGVGGKGIAESRPNDSFGIGYYYMWIRNPTFTSPLGTREFLQDENGAEAYYNFALTPWALLTPDIQVVRGSQRQTAALLPANRQDIETSVVMGVRLQLLF